MADCDLTLDIGDVSGPGRVGEILIRPISAGDNGTYWQSDHAGRIPLKYNDPLHAASDPAYDPEYTILGVGKWEPVKQGATYEFTVVRVNSTTVNESFTAVIPATSTANFSDLVPTIPSPVPPASLDTLTADLVAGPSDTNTALNALNATASTADRARANHTGVQAQSTVTNLVSDLALKAPLASPAFTGTPTGITKTHVGLSNVDNTSDVNKPVSTATTTQLNLKAPLASPAFTGTPTGITKTHVGLGNVDNTSDANKPISTAQAAALAVKSDDLDNSDFKKLLPWYNAVKNRASSSVDVVCLGDSIFEGYGLSNWVDSLPQQLATLLRSQLFVSGVTGARGFVGPQSDLVNHPFWPQVYTGGTVSAAGYGPNLRHYAMTATGHKVVHTVQAGGITRFDIHHLANNSSNMYYKIDGGSNVALPSTAGAGILQPTVTSVNLPVTSTIEVGWTSGTPIFTGITEFHGDFASGIKVHQVGASGTTAANWLAYSGFPTTAGAWDACLPLLNPDLIIINLGGNDARVALGNQTAAQFKTTLTSLIAAIRAKSMTCPIMVSMVYDPELPGGALNQPWSNYVDAIKQLAANDSTVICVDHSARMPAVALTDTYSLYNAAKLPHAAAKGYAQMAETEGSVLIPDDRFYRTIGGVAPLEPVTLGINTPTAKTVLHGDRQWKEITRTLTLADGTGTAEIAVASWTIPANTATANLMLKLAYFGQVSSTATLTYRIRVGPSATALASRAQAAVFTTSAAGAANTHTSGDVFLSFLTIGSGGTCTAGGAFMLGTATLPPTVAAFSAASVNTTVDNVVSISVVQSASQTLSSRGAQLTQLP